MKHIERRISHLEDVHGVSDPHRHLLPMFFYPDGLSEEAFDAWRAEELRCACPPGCQTPHVPVFLPEKEDAP